MLTVKSLFMLSSNERNVRGLSALTRSSRWDWLQSMTRSFFIAGLLSLLPTRSQVLTRPKHIQTGSGHAGTSPTPPAARMWYTGRDWCTCREHTQPCYAASSADFNFNLCFWSRLRKMLRSASDRKTVFLPPCGSAVLIFNKKSALDTHPTYLFWIQDRGHVLFHLTSRWTVLKEMMIQRSKKRFFFFFPVRIDWRIQVWI